MSDIDKQLINILINNNKELNDFVSTGGEGIFEKRYRRFIKNIILYHRNYNSCPSLATLKEFIGNNPSLKSYIEEIWNEVDELNVDSREFSYILSKLKIRYNQNIFDVVKEKFNTNVESSEIDEINNFLFKVTNEIQNIGKKSAYKEVVLKDSVKDWLSSFKAKAENKEIAQGVLTGFKTIDYYLNGLKPGELFVYGGASGSGKSIFLINLATNCFLGNNILPSSKDEAKNKEWKKTKNVLFISIEMGAEEIQNRILSCMCGVNSLNLDKGLVNADEAERLKKALMYWEHSGANLKIIDAPRGVSASTVQDFYDECCLDFKPDIIIVDYLGIMASDTKTDSDWLNIKHIAESLHELARVNSVPIVSAIQLKVRKPGEGEIALSSIGRSSLLAHDCNFVCIAEDREDEQSRIDLKLHFIKSRRGPLFNFSAKKCFQYSKIIDEGYSVEKNKSTLTDDDLTEAMNMLLGKEKQGSDG